METQDLMSTLKWSELAQIEEYLETPMDEWATIGSKAKLIMSIQWMLVKRNNPSFTIEQAENMTITELTELSGADLMVPKGETSV
jgi:hypothetical protein